MSSIPMNSFQRKVQNLANRGRRAEREGELHALILNVIDPEVADSKEIKVLEKLNKNWKRYIWAEVAIRDRRYIARFKEDAATILSLYGNGPLLVGRTALLEYSDGLTNIRIVGLLDTKDLINPNRVNVIYNIGI